MFCHRKEEDVDTTLHCAIKGISEFISFLAIIFSVMVIIVTAKRTKMNIINKLILQILISEVLDGINILLVILDDAQGSTYFEKKNSKTYICFSQIYISLFSCLWTLSASFFISLRIYDVMVKKNAIFKNKILQKYVLFLSIAIPSIISYFFWLIQMFAQSSKYKNLSKELYYQKYHSHDHFRHMYCWFNKEINYVIFILVIILIGANFYLSIIKGSAFVNKISTELKDTNEKYEGHNLQKKIDDMEHIKKSLWIYPITSGILWFLFFILQIMFSVNIKGTFLSLFYCLLISSRQVIYTLIFLYTQKDIQYQFIKFILCKKKKKKLRNVKGIIDDIQKGGEMLPNEGKIN